MFRPTRIVVHCSATPEGREHTAADIDRWHKERGWAGIGYHKVVRLDGTVEEGRPETKQGAHTLGYNVESLAVCYIGGVSHDHSPKDTRTAAQKTALLEVCADWCRRYDIAPSSVFGHTELNPNKACPCFDMAVFRQRLALFLVKPDKQTTQRTQSMKTMLIQQLVSVLLSMMTADVMKKAVDAMLDVAERAAIGSDSTLDDAIVLPLCRQIRKTFDIPDND